MHLENVLQPFFLVPLGLGFQLISPVVHLHRDITLVSSAHHAEIVIALEIFDNYV
jgi:hypothetical protein